MNIYHVKTDCCGYELNHVCVALDDSFVKAYFRDDNIESITRIGTRIDNSVDVTIVKIIASESL